MRARVILTLILALGACRADGGSANSGFAVVDSIILSNGSNAPAIVDVGINSSGEIAVIRAKTIELLDSAGRTLAVHNLPPVWGSSDLYASRISISSDGIIAVSNVNSDTILVFGRLGQLRRQSSHPLVVVHDISWVENDSLLIAVGYTNNERPGTVRISRLSEPTVFTEIASTTIRRWKPRLLFAGAPDAPIMVLSVFPRLVLELREDFAIGETWMHPDWKLDQAHLGGANGLAARRRLQRRRGYLTFAAKVNGRLVSLEAMSSIDRRLRVFASDGAIAAESYFEGVTGIVGTSQDGCRISVIESRGDSELLRSVQSSLLGPSNICLTVGGVASLASVLQN